MGWLALIAGTRSLEEPVLGVHMTGIGAIVELIEDLGGWRMREVLASPSKGVFRADDSMGFSLRKATERGGQTWDREWEKTSRRGGKTGWVKRRKTGTKGS